MDRPLAGAGRRAAALAMVLGLAATPVMAEPLALVDVVRLLEAGIGHDLVARQARRSGLAFAMGVDEMLALRDAGAGDALLGKLLDLSVAVPPSESQSDAGPVRIYVENRAGGPALILTNLDETGRRLDGGAPGPQRGVISSSERATWDQGNADGAPAPVSADTGPLPAAVEVTIRSEDAVRDERLIRLERRLDELETAEPARPPVGADLPRHAINDFREHPAWAPWGWGGPVLVPFAFAPQEFTVHSFGPTFSFTGARAAGFDPFKPVPPCSPGVACSVHQRLAHP